jgi:hypothetical protein
MVVKKQSQERKFPTLYAVVSLIQELSRMLNLFNGALSKDFETIF